MAFKNRRNFPVGSINEQGDFEGGRLVGKESKKHIHSDGKEGTDIYFQREIIKNGKVIFKEVAKDWGKIHNYDEKNN